MTNDSHDKLDQLRQKCDQLLDDSLSITAFARDVTEAVVEIEDVDAASVVEFLSPHDHSLMAGKGLEKLSLDGFYSLDPDHVSILLQSLQQQKTAVVTDRAVPEAGLKPHSIVITPVPGKEPPFRMIELFTLRVPNAEEVAHLKEVVETLAGYFTRYLHEQQGGKTPAITTDFWKQFDVFLLKLQQSMDMKQTVGVACNDGRTLIGCDRVSIALKHGKRSKIVGVSGQEGVQARANLLRAMATLATEVMKLGTPVTYRGTVNDLPPTLEVPLADYLSESRTRMVMMIPLRESKPILLDDEEITGQQKPKERKIIGCLFVEQATEARPDAKVVERTELLTEHIETAVHNTQRYENIFLLPLWRAIGRGVAWFKGRRRWIAAAILTGLTVLGLALAYIPWDYRVEATGQAMPVDQHEVFAPWDGDVLEVLVESGDTVAKGDVLIRLESDDLDAQRISIIQQLQELEKQINYLKTEIRRTGTEGREAEMIRAQGEQSKAIAEKEGAQAQLQKIESRLKKLEVTSPTDGVIATFQLKQLLQNRPVRRGELLLEVMQPGGPWRLELELPEYRMGHVMRALAKTDQNTLPVEYVLATHVETSFEGTLTEIATRSNESQEEGTIFEVYADINKEDLPSRNIGADVTAKINCGPKSLFYVLFGDVVEFLQRNLWF